MENIVIIGAGPAGLLLAHYLLATDQYNLEIYERRPDPRLNSEQTPRSFPVVLQGRGLAGLNGIDGLTSVVAQDGTWSQGSVLHRQRKEPRFLPRQSQSLIINRNRLTQVLLDELVKRDHAHHVTLNFDSTCVNIDLSQRTATLNNPIEEARTVKFDRLVGADGAISKVRESLQAQNALQAEQEKVADVYKSFSVARHSLDGHQELAGNAVHAWMLGKGLRLVMAPQADNRLNGTLIFPPERNPLADCHTDEAVLDYIEDTIPSLHPFMTLEDAHQLRLAPISSLTTVKCDRLNVADKVLLIGDAAHAVSPSIGQGCNSSLQDALIFNQVLTEHRLDWSNALPAFTERRLADVHALRDLSDYVFPRSPRMKAEFIFRVTIGKKLRRRFPKLLTPLPMELIMETDQSYSSILKQCQRWIDGVRQSSQ